MADPHHQYQVTGALAWVILFVLLTGVATWMTAVYELCRYVCRRFFPPKPERPVMPMDVIG